MLPDLFLTTSPCRNRGPSSGGDGGSGSEGRDPPAQPNDPQQQQEMDLDPEKGQKRGRDSQEGASEMPSESHSTGLGTWITPNRPRPSPRTTFPFLTTGLIRVI